MSKQPCSKCHFRPTCRFFRDNMRPADCDFYTTESGLKEKQERINCLQALIEKQREYISYLSGDIDEFHYFDNTAEQLRKEISTLEKYLSR